MHGMNDGTTHCAIKFTGAASACSRGDREAEDLGWNVLSSMGMSTPRDIACDARD